MYTDFTSLPPDQEREFIVYEQRTREAEKSAWRTGSMVAGLYGLLMVIVVMSYDKPAPLIAEEDIAVEETRRRVVEDDDDLAAPAPAPTPSPAPAPEAAPTEGAPAEGSTAPVVPPPPPGATKASPADLVKANQ
jgi:hypothetical protein